MAVPALHSTAGHMQVVAEAVLLVQIQEAQADRAVVEMAATQGILEQPEAQILAVVVAVLNLIQLHPLLAQAEAAAPVSSS